MPISQDELTKKIMSKFPNAVIEIKDLVGDENHYSLEISSEEFAGKTKLQQHRLVNEALKDCLGEALHALTVKIKN